MTSPGFLKELRKPHENKVSLYYFVTFMPSLQAATFI